MKIFFASYVFITLLAALWVFSTSSSHNGNSFLWGAFLTFSNIAVLTWGWRLIFRKKLVALASGVIVFKYAILGLIIYFLIENRWVSVEWMVAGLSVLLPSILVFALISHRLN